MIADVSVAAPAPMSTGVYPVAFEIPTEGRLFTFGQVMIVDKNPVVSITYWHVRILHTGVCLLLAGLVMSAFQLRTRRTQLMEWFLKKGISLGSGENR